MNDAIMTKHSLIKQFNFLKLSRRPILWLRYLTILLFITVILGACTSQLQQKGPSGQQGAEPLIRVSLEEDFQKSTLAFDGNFLLRLEEAHYRFDKSIGTLNVFFRDGYLILKNDHRFFELPAPKRLLFEPEFPGYTFMWNDVPYRGSLSIFTSQNQVVAVNELPVETYLHGVVPLEMPSTQEDYREAVYSQAIAARSYALYRLEHPASALYDVWADERDQVYRGMLKTTPLSDKAIADTRGIVLAKGDAPIMVNFHSTCGGVLEVTGNSMPEGASNGGSVFAYDLTENEYNCKVSPYYRWVEVRTTEAVVNNLRREFGLDSLTIANWLETGFRMNIDIKKRKPSGRIEQLVINVGEESFPVNAYRIRKVLADATGKPLPSNFFFINESPADTERFYIIGAGAGHGRGMCQWGAIGMALKGYSHRNILGFYYPELTMIKYY